MSNLTAIPTTAQPHGTDELVEMPTWLPNGCPSWCEYGDLHRENDQHDDREHYGRGHRIEASTEPRIDFDQHSTMDIHLQQHYREAEARVWVGYDVTNKGKHLTIDEARELALRILELTKEADGI